jgi:outer membrane protein assembly factor BamB
MITKSEKVLLTTVLVLLIPLSSTAQDTKVTIQKTWEAQTGAAIYGGVRTDESSVYAGGEDGVLRVFDKESGQLTWSYDSKAAITSNATMDDKRVYFHTRTGVVHALDRSNGKEFLTC